MSPDFILPSEYNPLYPITKKRRIRLSYFPRIYLRPAHARIPSVICVPYFTWVMSGSVHVWSDIAAPGANWVSFCAPIRLCWRVGGDPPGFNQIRLLCWLSQFLEDGLEVFVTRLKQELCISFNAE